jgi:hypothetical protein
VTAAHPGWPGGIGSAEGAVIRAGALRRAARRLRDLDHGQAAQLLEMWAVETGEPAASNPLAAGLGAYVAAADLTQQRQDRALERLAEFATGGVFAALDVGDATDVLAVVAGLREVVADLSRSVALEVAARQRLAQDVLRRLMHGGGPAGEVALDDLHQVAYRGGSLEQPHAALVYRVHEDVIRLCGAQLGDQDGGSAGPGKDDQDAAPQPAESYLPADPTPDLPAAPGRTRQLAIHSPLDGTYEVADDLAEADRVLRSAYLYPVGEDADPDAHVVVRDWTAGPWRRLHPIAQEQVEDDDPRADGA